MTKEQILQMVQENAAIELKTLQRLVGRTVVNVEYDHEAETVYRLFLDDGKTVEFSSSGDDATMTSITITPA